METELPLLMQQSALIRAADEDKRLPHQRYQQEKRGAHPEAALKASSLFALRNSLVEFCVRMGSTKQTQRRTILLRTF